MMPGPQMFARKSYCRYVNAFLLVALQPIQSLRSYTPHSPFDSLLGLGRAKSADNLFIVRQEHSFCPVFGGLAVIAVLLVGVAECFMDGNFVGIEFECVSVLLDCLIIAARAVQGITQVLANANRKWIACQRPLAFCKGFAESPHDNQEKGIRVVYFVEPWT